MSKLAMPPLNELKALISYNPETGDFTWIKSGKPAGSINKKGYLLISLNKVRYYGHRLAWYIQTGEDPGDMEVDHKNHIKSDNSFNNLRPLTHQKNQFNRVVKGYSWNKERNKYTAQIGIDGVKKYLGNFDCPLMAHLAYKDAKAQYHTI